MLLVLFALLFASAAFLAVEVVTGTAAPEAGLRRWLRAAVFALAAGAGGTLLVALPLAEWVLIVAIVPLTAISLIRAMAIVGERVSGWRGPALVVAVVIATVVVGVQSVPVPLTRAEIQSVLPGAPAPSVRPDAGRLVRT